MSSSDQTGSRTNVSFNTTLDAELQEMERQVDLLQEEVKLKNLQETAAEDEGTRKKAGAVGGSPQKGVRSIFVSGFDTRTTEADLRLFFSGCGTFTRVTLLKDKVTGQNKGSAYIELETPEQAQAALVKDGQSMHGRPLKIALKRDNIPGYNRGGYYAPRGRGGNPQLAAMAMAMSMMSGAGMGFSPFPRGRGRGGRGRGQ